MSHWAADWARKLGGSVELREIGTQSLGGVTVPLPPVVLAAIPAVPDPSKKTVCVYGTCCQSFFASVSHGVWSLRVL
jgi:hypothetical protein